jgi:adenine phosphoribosyltransferase
MKAIRDLIRDIPDFPKKGIIFKDITPVLNEPVAFHQVIQAISDRYAGQKVDKIAAIESRGFIFGAPVAFALQKGLAIIRKPGKLPYATFREEYSLEYGTDIIEIHQDAFQPGDRVVLVDDLLATGGTALAAARLIEKAGGKVAEICFLIELGFLHGREKIGNYPIHSFVKF